MYKTILVPLDGSNLAEAILPHVEDLAQSYRAEVVLLRVVEPHFHEVESFSRIDAEAFKRAREEAESYLAITQNRFHQKEIPGRIIVAHGPVVEAIIKAAEREKVDLIAMASHGRTGLARVFYGSVAAGVLHRIDRPLLLIRAIGKD